MAILEPALDFLLRHGEAVFEGVPIVFCGVSPSDLNRNNLRPNVTGVLVERDFGPTLDLALTLQPDTRNVFVIGGVSRFDRNIQNIARAQLEPFRDRAEIAWLTDLPMDELLAKVAALPAHSIIYYLSTFTDGAGDALVPHEVLTQIAQVANSPVYASLDQYIGIGAVGGFVYSIATHGEQAAAIGLRILRGERPSTIPIAALAAQTYVFDWRELRRWGINERQLPPGSLVEFRQPSIWDLYKWYIAAGAALLLLQSILVLGLVANRAQRRRAELERQAAEDHRRRAEAESHRRRDELAHALRVATLGELTASFAHELSQPLTAITANAQAARKMFAIDGSDPEIREVLEDVASDALRATDTFRRLRALFRKEPTERAALDVNALIDDVLRLLATSLRNRFISVRFDRDEHLPAVLADGVQLRQVVINVLINAEDAIALASGGPREIAIETRFTPTAVSIAIRDSGIGLDPADLERIFEHFFTSKPQGLGLGLAISRSIIQAHGGRMWASRNEDRGITVHIELPSQPGLRVADFDLDVTRNS